MKKILQLILALTTFLVYSQNKKVTLSWDGITTIATDSYSFEIPSFSPSKNYVFNLDNGLRYVNEWEVRTPVNENSVSVTNVTYSSISEADLKALKISKIPSELKYSLTNAKSRNKSYAVFSLTPIIKDGTNSFKRVTGFTINYNSSSVNRSNNARAQVITNSVLSSGIWYKFEIDKTRVIGEEDGVFDNGDYIVFYGQGPNGFNEDSNTHLNIYTDKAFYYLNIGAGQGKRVAPFIEPAGSPNLTINTFQDYKFHELDEENLVQERSIYYNTGFS